MLTPKEIHLNLTLDEFYELFEMFKNYVNPPNEQYQSIYLKLFEIKKRLDYVADHPANQ